MAIERLLGAAFALLAIAGSAWQLAAAAFTVATLGRACATAVNRPAVTLLKPMRGDHPGLERTLASLAAIDWPAPVQFVFGFQSGDDPALPRLRAWREAHPELDVEIVVDPTPHGANPKVANLTNMAPWAKHELLALSDADIVVPRGYLEAIAAALAEPGIGAATAFYRGEGAAGFWSTVGAMGISYGFTPAAVFGWRSGMAKPCFGSTIALSRASLDAIGGFSPFADVLADDYEIGRAIRARGLEVAIPPILLTHLCDERSLGQTFAHELRWARTVRRIDPAGHLGSAVTHPFALALVASVLSGGAAWALAATALALAARFAAKGLIDKACGETSGPAWLLPARDLLSFTVFAASLFGDEVRWTERRLAVDRAGRLGARA